MSDKLRKQIAVEREQITRLIADHRSILEKATSETPSTVERSALGYLLHSFYSGIENVLKRIAFEYDGGSPGGESWHQQLLSNMATATPLRPAVLSPELFEIMDEYLAFRHFFRYSYSFHLQWEKMSQLVLNCESTMRRFEAEIELFLSTVPDS